MAQFPTEKNVGRDERVSLLLGTGETKHFEEYTIRASILEQPSTFSVRLSAAGGTAALLKQLPPRTAFELRLGGQPQFTGELDGFEAYGTEGETSVTLFGRSPIARLIDSDVDAERSFTNVSYEQLVTKAMQEVGLGDRLLFSDNAANREIKSGYKVKTVREPTIPQGVVGLTQGVAHVVHAKLGETWFHFLQRHLAKAGLFLFDEARGNLVISTPNKHQQPSLLFQRQRGQLRNVVNVESAHWRNDTTKRFSECIIYARATGRKFGRLKTKGLFVDADMVSLGYTKRRVYRDVNVTNADEAAFYARRKIAALARSGWKLTYTLSGHSAPTDAAGGRAVICPDMVATVKDDELGIHEDLYVESVEYSSPPRRTRVTMMRLQDLVFGEDD